MPKERTVAEICDRQDEIALAVAGVESIIKNHNEPLIAKRSKLVAEYNELQKEKERLTPKKDEEPKGGKA